VTLEGNQRKRIFLRESGEALFQKGTVSLAEPQERGDAVARQGRGHMKKKKIVMRGNRGKKRKADHAMRILHSFCSGGEGKT